MEAEERDGAAVRFPPPFVYLIALVLGGALQLAWPWHLGLGLGARLVLAAAAAALGAALVADAIGHFRRTGQDPKPWLATPEVIATGVYRYTRNPMYVGMASLQAAIGAAFASVWILALVPVVLAVVYGIAVRHEEAYLERKFGDTYRAYRQSVRRWL
jgi:protein-S-isoprenylcysteine O-methyltransferase Ste14